MRILQLQASNVLRLVAVDITPHGDLVIVGGKNGAGKSSVLDAISMALGGLALAPPEPIRAGEHEAKIVVDLGELKVTRRFSRVKLPCECADCAAKRPTDQHDPNCPNRTRWSDITSTLSVTNAEGTAKYASPQKMLDDLLGKLTFDPLAFAQDKDVKRQAETLRKLVGLDTSKIDDRRRAAASKRAVLKKEAEAKLAVALALPEHKDAPAAEVPMESISNEMLEAERLRKLADDARREVDKAKDAVTVANDQLTKTQTRLDDARRRVEELEGEVKGRTALHDDAVKALDARQITYDAAAAVVPDSAAVRAKLAEAEATNAKVRANAARAAAMLEAERLSQAVDLEHEAVVRCDEERAAAIAAAKFPVEGLGLTDDGVTFQGLPFSQASTSEQLRVSVAVGIALNPKVKVLLVRNGNALDEDSLKQVAEQAEAADCQVWCEWVTKSAEGVSVMIEGGRVAAAEEGPVHTGAQQS